MVHDGEEQQPKIEQRQDRAEAEERVEQGSREKIAAKRRGDSSETKTRRPIQKRADLPINPGSNDEQQNQHQKQMPRLETGRLRSSHRPGESIGSRLIERVELSRAP